MKGVRSSKYRHVYGDPNRKDKCFDNIKLTKNAFDANLAKSNGKYVSLNWEASGGGSFAVLPTKEIGKIPDRFPLFDGHKGPVLDTDWNPFDDEMVVSASDDGTIGVWKVPEDFTVHAEYKTLDDCQDVKPVKFLEGHGKKVGHVSFNPVAKGILASASLDNSVKIWNVDTGKVLFTLKHPSFVTSFSWNYDGTKIATVAKDRHLRIWDVRAEKITSEGKGHAGAKGSRVVWLGDRERVLTTGFSLVSDRETAIWDSSDIPKGPVGGFKGLDPSSGIVIPHYDPMTSMVYLGGRGDGKLVYFEYADDKLYDLFAYNSTSPQRGLGWAPNHSLNIHDHEVARVYKVHETMVEPISFKVPLKNDGFLDNVYTFVEVGVPALTADEWSSGKTARPLVRNWKQIYNNEKADTYEAPKWSDDNAETAESESLGSKSPEKSEKFKKSEKSETPQKSETPEKSKVPEKSESSGKSKSLEKTGSEISKSDSSSNKSAENSSPTSKKDSKSDDAQNKSPSAKKEGEKIAALSKAEKQDSYDVLQSKEVKSFLEKNAQKEDSDHTAEKEDDQDSAWDNEPEERKQPAFVQKKAEQTPSEVGAKQTGANGENSEVKHDSNKDSQIAEPKAERESIRAQIRRETAKLSKANDLKNSKSEESSADTKAVSNLSDSEKLDEILRTLTDLNARLTRLEGSSY